MSHLVLLPNAEYGEVFNDFFVGKWSVVAELYDGLKATATLGATTVNTL